MEMQISEIIEILEQETDPGIEHCIDVLSEIRGCKKSYAIYRDEEAASWQGMCVGERYEILEATTPNGGILWYKTCCVGEEKTRWTSSACFEEVFEE